VTNILTGIFQAKEYLANPEAFAVAAPATAVEEAAPAAAKEEEKKEDEEDEDDDMVGLVAVSAVGCTMLTPSPGLRSLRLSELLMYFVVCSLLYSCTWLHHPFQHPRTRRYGLALIGTAGELMVGFDMKHSGLDVSEH
jgi:hypothetical protein